MSPVITSYCKIRSGAVTFNGDVVYTGDAASPAEFLKEAYKSCGLNYPKFHKMDHLSKLGLIAAEYCLRDPGFLQRNDPAATAIVLSNHASSLDTDRAHQATISDPSRYLPSPAVFVYTLPNIVIGELAIKYKLTGENAFFVSDAFDAGLMTDYTLQLLSAGAAASALCGWVNYDGSDYEAFIYLVELPGDSIKNANFKALNKITLYQLYTH
ncbi:MAG: 3-oxoacyl-ACP synthase [Bacteroidia bacterium]